MPGGAFVAFGYDTAGQLVSEQRVDSANAYSIDYSYDGAGNRLSKSVNGATESYSYDAANKLLSAGEKSYAYDGAGNVASVTSPAGTTSLSWDGASRLSGITFPGDATNSFAYNGLGQRVGKADSSGTFGYTLADDSIDSNVLGDGAASYQYGLGLVSEVRGGASRVYHADSLGTTRAMSDAGGTASASLDTDAFGNTVSASGTGTPFGFAGQHGYQSDVDSGLMRLGHRFYDSSVGRFLSRDPIQDGYNWYTYCDNDPLNAVDPEGLANPWRDFNKMNKLQRLIPANEKNLKEKEEEFRKDKNNQEGQNPDPSRPRYEDREAHRDFIESLKKTIDRQKKDLADEMSKPIDPKLGREGRATDITGGIVLDVIITVTPLRAMRTLWQTFSAAKDVLSELGRPVPTPKHW